jgi:hypothetical protein
MHLAEAHVRPNMKLTHVALAFASASISWGQFAVQIHTAGPLPGGPFNEKVVTGKPFMASVEMETNQTLADGNHITNKQRITVARDSQGRTRREETLPAPSGDGQQVKTVFISDPVAQANYVLGPDHVAHKFPFLKSGSPPDITSTGQPAPQGNQQGSQPSFQQGSQHVQRFSTAGAPAGAGEIGLNASFDGPVNAITSTGPGEAGGMALNVSVNAPGDSKTDPLGTQTISGVQADGNRNTLTIPAGQMGNDTPLVITDERWYSQELQATVMSKHNDPRLGESLYQLTNIQKIEPPASMFQVPSDYPIEEPR